MSRHLNSDDFYFRRTNIIQNAKLCVIVNGQCTKVILIRFDVIDKYRLTATSIRRIKFQRNSRYRQNRTKNTAYISKVCEAGRKTCGNRVPERAAVQFCTRTTKIVFLAFVPGPGATLRESDERIDKRVPERLPRPSTSSAGRF